MHYSGMNARTQKSSCMMMHLANTDGSYNVDIGNLEINESVCALRLGRAVFEMQILEVDACRKLQNLVSRL